LNRRSTKLETARDFYGQMLDIFREVAAQAPDVVQWQRAVAVSLGKIANTNFIMGDYKAAESSYQEVLQQFRKLATADPANNDTERDVAQTLTHIGDVRWQRDDRGGANQPYEEALRITRNLLRQDPENLDWQMDLVTALRDSAYTASDPAYVRELLDEGSALARSLAANELLSPEYRPTLNTVAADLTALAERGRAR
jgi:tetratricopeptide (TPR) repeat protein